MDYLHKQLFDALESMDKMHKMMMMAKANHRASFYDAECLDAMNNAPILAAQAMAAYRQAFPPVVPNAKVSGRRCFSAVRLIDVLAVERTMKTCTVCGKEKPASDYRLHSDKKTVMRYCNDCHLAKRRAQHAAKREERNAQFRARYAANANGVKDKMAAARKAKYAKQGRAALIEWAAANPEKAAEAQRKKMKRGRERLSDYYVRRLLCHPERSAVRKVPTVLIECKRLQLMIERECREKR